MKKRSWVCTIFTQMCLCFALYLAVNVGRPHNSRYRKRSGSGPLDLYFLSVRGGFRPIEQQTHLLKQMERVAKTYKAMFVLNSSELGEDDPLAQNATQHLSQLKIPWYTTRTSERHGVVCFNATMKISGRKSLDIIGVNTELLQESSLMGFLSENENSQLQLLIKTLEESRSNWRIVVGHHPLAVCRENKQQMDAEQTFKTLKQMFLRFAVDVYLSGQNCSNYPHEGNLAYIGNPSSNEKESYALFLKRESVFSGELANGFLLHRVSPLQIATYFITSSGEFKYKTTLQQKSRAIIEPIRLETRRMKL